MVLLLLLVGRAFVRSFSSSSSLLQLFRESMVCACGQRRDRQRGRPLCHQISVGVRFFHFFNFYLFHTLPLPVVKSKSSLLVSLNRRGKKHNREEGDKEEDKEEEDKEEEEER